MITQTIWLGLAEAQAIPEPNLHPMVRQLLDAGAAGYLDCPGGVASEILKQAVQAHPEFTIAQHIQRLISITNAHEFLREGLEDLGWTVEAQDADHAAFGWGRFEGEETIQHYIRYDAREPNGSAHAVEVVDGEWINPIPIPGLAAPLRRA
jgi:hypothetical protein